MPTRSDHPLTPDSKLVRARDAARWAQVSRSTFYNWVAAGRVPKGVALSAGVVVWDLAEIAAALSKAEVR